LCGAVGIDPGVHARRAVLTSMAPQGSDLGTEALYKAKRFAVKFSPPCIFLEYEDSSAKTRVREVRGSGCCYPAAADMGFEPMRMRGEVGAVGASFPRLR
jgi:hypothetical protein